MPGVVTVIAAWMLDPVVGSGMATIGAPRAAVSALIDVHLQIERGFRRRSRGDCDIAQEKQHDLVLMA